ncbi:MAG TPA: hypothetical protein ENN35_07780 [Deltaproteobacteria bacterium]|nr:hypothetical protein [Deltaproteobacteria bacterium]
MHIPSPVTSAGVFRTTGDNPDARALPKVPDPREPNPSFSSILADRVSDSEAPRNRYAAPSADSFEELAVLLKKRINEHVLFSLRGARKATPFAGRSLALLKESLTRIADVSPGNIFPVGKNEAAGSIENIIVAASQQYGVDENLVRAVVKAESDFQAGSTSSKGAMGLMQLMPETARDLGVENPYDPAENVTGGVRYLRMLMDRYGGDVDQALAAYNWGMGNLDRSDGSLPGETRTYLARVRRYYEEFGGSALSSANLYT